MPRRFRSFENKKQAAHFEHRGEVARHGLFVGEVMHRVIADQGIEFLPEWRALHVMDEKAAAERRLVIDPVGQAAHAIFRNPDQVRADVDPGDVVTEPREIFTQPARPAGHVQDPGAGWQLEHDGNVREVAKLAMRLRIHAAGAAKLREFVREVVERLRAQMMQTFRIELARIFDRRALVIDPLELGKSAGGWIRSHGSRLATRKFWSTGFRCESLSRNPNGVMRTKTMELSGWGRYPRRNGRVARPETVGSIQFAEETSLVARGWGRSYGDAAIPAESGCALLTERLNRYLAFDENTGILRAEAGTTLAEVLETFVPRGWFPAVTPGTKFVSLGGCVAADVHGKNHHQAGTFGAQTTGLEIKLADGTHVTCSPAREAELFRATIGGMGLTGVITEVSFRLVPIETAFMMTRHLPARDLEECLRLLENPVPDEHVACWIDGIAKGARLGSGVMLAGRPARRDEWNQAANHPLNYRTHRAPRLPFSPPSWMLNHFASSIFNRLYARRQTRKAATFLADLESFFYPLDAVENWNAFYGKAGFVQHQCVLPSSNAAAGFRRMLETLAASGLPSFLTVLKRFRGEGAGLLSFPMEGYTLSLDFAMRGAPLFDLLRKLDAIVLQQGGRVYLAKDACLDAETFRAMYPRYREWQEVKARVDPAIRFRSALSERLGLTPPS